MRFKEFIELDEMLSVIARRQKARQMKRLKRTISVKKKIALRRAANADIITRRARRIARAEMYKKISKGKSASDLPALRRMSIEKRLARFSRRLDKLAKRKVPYARKIDRDRRSA